MSQIPSTPIAIRGRESDETTFNFAYQYTITKHVYSQLVRDKSGIIVLITTPYGTMNETPERHSTERISDFFIHNLGQNNAM